MTDHGNETKITVRSTNSDNPIVDHIDDQMETTVRQTAVDPDTQFNPWNPDDLYQKAGDYTIYEKMMKDDQVEVAMAIKKDLIIGSGWHIRCEDDGDEDVRRDVENALSEDVESPFDDIMSEMLTAYDFGFSVSEKQFKTRADGSLTLKNIKTRHPVSWLFHQDVFGNIIRYEQQGSPEDKFLNIDPHSLIHLINNPKFGNPYGTSDLRAAYSAYFIKTHIVRYYAIFLEKAASPIPIAKYDKGVAEDVDIQKIHNAIKKFQTATAITFPKEFELDFLETANKGEPFIKGLSLFNMFIGRALFVPDLLGFQGGPTTGGSQALGREQMTVFFKHIMRRRRTLESMINKHIIKPLVIWNYGFEDHFPKFKLNPIDDDIAEKNAKLWLEAVRGRVYRPNLEEINHFKKIIEFPESTEEDMQDPKEIDHIDVAAQDATTEDDDDEKENDDKKNDKEEFAKKPFDFPKGDYHKKTNFKSIERLLDNRLDVFEATVNPIIKEITVDYTKKLERGNILKPEKIDRISNIKPSKALTNKLNNALDLILKDTFDQSKIMASEEIFKSNFAIQAAPAFAKTIAEENFSFVGDWVFNLSKATRIAVVEAIKDGRPISSVINDVTTYLDKDSKVQIERYSRTKFTEVMNKGRISFFDESGVVDAYQYAAVLDGRTTIICEGLHGKIFKAGDQPIPPMHFNCRSIVVPITKFEEFNVDNKVGKRDMEEFIENEKGKGFSKQ